MQTDKEANRGLELNEPFDMKPREAYEIMQNTDIPAGVVLFCDKLKSLFDVCVQGPVSSELALDSMIRTAFIAGCAYSSRENV